MRLPRKSFFSVVLLLSISTSGWSAETRTISQEKLRDKIYGYWIGQLAGNYMGFPFENLYLDEPIPIDIDRYFDFRDAEKFGLKMNLNDRRSYTRIMADAMGGAWSDDDTDIEFVTLHALEKYGLDLNYAEITEMWKQHINRFIWSASRKARDLMEEGMLPPATGARENNEYWYRITSQLMNEIWGVIYPGITHKAAERSEWGARIMTDSWATHPDIVYGVMYSAAIFEDDPEKLVRLAMNYIPEESPFLRGMADLLQWRKEEDDWRVVRKRMHDKYATEIDGFEIPYPVGGAVINGLASILAILYGEGNFVKTVSIAVSAGYDCDNQAATCGGLLGIIDGGSSIP
ncbi:MAG: ADP-ribosylglycohydrolase family protein, partial [Verrucomicrobiae bacterium]|nr:ADP-ribosylglycohydrolase family protein [Verrucomicrobiae bacterium]